MKYFTIGPVQMYETVLKAGGRQAEYFRDSDFAERTILIQNQLKELFNSGNSSQIAMLSGSGTSVMEASVVNFAMSEKKALVINSGSFGQRFVDICKFHGMEVSELSVQPGRDLDVSLFEARIKDSAARTVFVTMHETSTGQLMPVDVIGDICRENEVLLICDAVSSVAADKIDMSGWGIDILLFSSNKGLGLSPGVGFLIASEFAFKRMHSSPSYYFDIKRHFEGSVRGQPPFTPSISVLMQLEAWLARIKNIGGIDEEIRRIAKHADWFRKSLLKLGLHPFPQTPSNAITAFKLNTGNSEELYRYLKEEHNMLINKSAFGLKVELPRISHIGNLSMQDHKNLSNALENYLESGI